MTYTAAGIAIAIALGTLALRALRQPTMNRTMSVTSLRDVRELLDPKEVPTSDQLLARALPNVRLIRAFHLTNTFVSSDVDVHHHFTSTARKLMDRATPSRDWHFFAESATSIVANMTSSTNNIPFPFDKFVQHLTLKVILHTLFEVPSANLDDEGIALVAHGINTLWKLSKSQQELPAYLLPAMNTHLRAWLPEMENPLDFVIPTFETLWRVVAITVAVTYKDPQTKDAFQRLLENPVKGQFDEFHSDHDTPSVNAVVSEVMRLHPPTKTVSRAFPSTPVTLTDRIKSVVLHTPPLIAHVASIRSVQRDPEIWGSDAEDFNPMRHHPDTLTAEQSAAMLSFGLGKLKCVASSWAPMAVGIIASAVLEQLGDTIAVVEGDVIGGREGWDDWFIVPVGLRDGGADE